MALTEESAKKENPEGIGCLIVSIVGLLALGALVGFFWTQASRERLIKEELHQLADSYARAEDAEPEDLGGRPFLVWLDLQATELQKKNRIDGYRVNGELVGAIPRLCNKDRKATVEYDLFYSCTWPGYMLRYEDLEPLERVRQKRPVVVIIRAVNGREKTMSYEIVSRTVTTPGLLGPSSRTRPASGGGSMQVSCWDYQISLVELATRTELARKTLIHDCSAESVDVNRKIAHDIGPAIGWLLSKLN